LGLDLAKELDRMAAEERWEIRHCDKADLSFSRRDPLVRAALLEAAPACSSSFKAFALSNGNANRRVELAGCHWGWRPLARADHRDPASPCSTPLT